MVRAALMAAALVAGCTQSGLDGAGEPPPADLAFFRCEVQPVLAARCAFMACHGTPERPLLIYAEQRVRIDVPWAEYETPLSEVELATNFHIARGFIDPATGEHLLADKPLDADAGGMFHRGKDQYGAEDVFLSRDDVGYQVLRAFGDGATAADDCEPRTEVGL